MSSEGSVTRWYHELEKGNEAAATELWDHFFDRVVKLASHKLGSSPRQVRDEEDIAISAFKSLCKGIQRGRFPALSNREDLWRLLIVITSRKVQDQIAYQHRQKRSTDAPQALAEDDLLVNEAVSREPTPEFAAQMADTIDGLMQRLSHEDLRSIAMMKLEGYTNAEIAERLKRGVATIERKLRTIRTLWEETP